MSAVNHDRYVDAYLRKILRDSKTIAMVGASANWNRPSYFAMKYLLDRGYKVIPVNPAAAGQEIMGQKVYASMTPLQRMADPAEIGAVAAFLASQDSSFMTASEVAVDGGLAQL